VDRRNVLVSPCPSLGWGRALAAVPAGPVLGGTVDDSSHGADTAAPGQLTCLDERCGQYHQRERGPRCRGCGRRTKPRPAPALFRTLGYGAPADGIPPAAPADGAPAAGVPSAARPAPPPDLFRTLGYSAPPQASGPAGGPVPAAPPARSPYRLQPGRAGVAMAISVVQIVVLWLWRGPLFGLLWAVLCPLWILNVLLGAGLDDPAWEVFGRMRRFRATPETFR
jgi:hypothetical protein